MIDRDHYRIVYNKIDQLTEYTPQLENGTKQKSMMIFISFDSEFHADSNEYNQPR